MPALFRTERATYDRNRARLLRRHHGEFVLIQGRKIHGIFPTEVAGIVAGYRRLGRKRAFFVHRIEKPEEEITYTLGIVSVAP